MPRPSRDRMPSPDKLEGVSEGELEQRDIQNSAEMVDNNDGGMATTTRVTVGVGGRDQVLLKKGLNPKTMRTDFGFTVIERGGKVVVDSVRPDGPAQAKLAVGQVLLRIQSVHQPTLQEVRSRMQSAAASGTELDILVCPRLVSTTRTLVLRRPNVVTSFGFKFRTSSTLPGSYVHSVFYVADTGPANDVRMGVGDMLVSADGTELHRVGHDALATMLSSGTIIALVVRDPSNTEIAILADLDAEGSADATATAATAEVQSNPFAPAPQVVATRADRRSSRDRDRRSSDKKSPRKSKGFRFSLGRRAPKTVDPVIVAATPPDTAPQAPPSPVYALPTPVDDGSPEPLPAQPVRETAVPTRESPPPVDDRLERLERELETARNREAESRERENTLRAELKATDDRLEKEQLVSRAARVDAAAAKSLIPPPAVRPDPIPAHAFDDLAATTELQAAQSLSNLRPLIASFERARKRIHWAKAHLLKFESTVDETVDGKTASSRQPMHGSRDDGHTPVAADTSFDEVVEMDDERAPMHEASSPAHGADGASESDTDSDNDDHDADAPPAAPTGGKAENEPWEERNDHALHAEATRSHTHEFVIDKSLRKHSLSDVYVAPNDIPGNEAHGEPNRTLDSVSENDDDVPPPPPSASGARLLWGGSRASEKTRVSPDDLPPSPLSGGKARGVAGSDHSEEPSDYVAPASIPVGPGQFVSGAAVRGLHTYVPPTGEGDDDDGQPRVAFEKGDRMIVLEVHMDDGKPDGWLKVLHEGSGDTGDVPADWVICTDSGESNSDKDDGQSAAPSDAALPGRKKALLIAISYSNTDMHLEGTLEDSQHVNEKLLEEGGFVPSQIQMINEAVDSECLPTKSNIMKGLQWLVKGARGGDKLFMHLAGHGGHIRDSGSDEADGKDEFFFPMDHVKNKRATLVTDDELFDMIAKDLPTGVELDVIMDCCNSGSSIDLKWGWNGKTWSHHSPRTTSAAGGRVVCLSACQDWEASAETDAFNGELRGALTYCWLEVVAQSGSYAELYDSIIALLTNQSTHFQQQPILSSNVQLDLLQTTYAFLE